MELKNKCNCNCNHIFKSYSAMFFRFHIPVSLYSLYIHLPSMSFCGIHLTTLTLGEGFVGGSPFNFQITFCGNLANASLKTEVTSSSISLAIDPIEKRTTPAFPALSR